jgi:glycosyltransferase involved in cell wall biosynthesis
MRIVHLSAEKTWRGGEQQIAYLIDELNLLNIDQLVVCRKESAFEKYCMERSIPYKSLGIKNQFDVTSSLQLKKICYEFQADIMHIHSSHAHAIAVWSYFMGNNTNMVLSRKVDFEISNNILSSIKYNCSGIKKIICVSNAIKKIMQSSISEPEKCLTIYDGIDLQKFSPNHKQLHKLFNIDAQKKIILCTSALAEHKDYPTLINAIEQLVGKFPFQVIVFGDGPLADDIKQLVKDRNLSNFILFGGFRTDINDLLPSADAFVMSSKTEGLGSSILDAYACKVPVACTNAGGIPEIAIHMETALLSNAKDANALANAIEQICTHTDLAADLKNKAYEFVQKFDKKIMAEKTLSVYKNIISV